MATYSLMSLVWTLVALLIGAMQIASSILLLRERNAGPWLMLAGAVLSLIGHVATQFAVFSMNRGMGSTGGPGVFPGILTALSSATILGSLLFVGGLLFYALTRRGLAARVAELEAILQSGPPR